MSGKSIEAFAYLVLTKAIPSTPPSIVNGPSPNAAYCITVSHFKKPIQISQKYCIILKNILYKNCMYLRRTFGVTLTLTLKINFKILNKNLNFLLQILIHYKKVCDFRLKHFFKKYHLVFLKKSSK
ncbi:hypothetical protein PUN28_002075 [Cardiocondyla obscurior]|uniref:Uncharacterized protein n=1 Tax=Cardiocondyla obscurior TaxID=286306 RepID=A0AAW2GSG1_9HYME